MRWFRVPLVLAAFSMSVSAADVDPDNPTCPLSPVWGPEGPMQLRTIDQGGKRILIAEGDIDPAFPDRLRAAIDADEAIEEVWLRSAGGDARAGNEAGRVIRSYNGVHTRIPSGWTCFSACNFIFMGGLKRSIEPGGMFMVHMFTFTNQRDVISDSVEAGADDTTELIGEIEQMSALLATEDNDFLIRMGVSRDLLTDIMYQQLATGGAQQKGQRYCLSLEEARRYNVTNDVPLGTAAN